MAEVMEIPRYRDTEILRYMADVMEIPRYRDTEMPGYEDTEIPRPSWKDEIPRHRDKER